MKEETVGGVFVAAFFLGGFLFILFGWAPVSKYLGEWNDYWSSNSADQSTYSDCYGGVKYQKIP